MEGAFNKGKALGLGPFFKYFPLHSEHCHTFLEYLSTNTGRQDTSIGDTDEYPK